MKPKCVLRSQESRPRMECGCLCILRADNCGNLSTWDFYVKSLHGRNLQQINTKFCFWTMMTSCCCLPHPTGSLLASSCVHPGSGLEYKQRRWIIPHCARSIGDARGQFRVISRVLWLHSMSCVRSLTYHRTTLGTRRRTASSLRTWSLTRKLSFRPLRSCFTVNGLNLEDERGWRPCAMTTTAATMKHKRQNAPPVKFDRLHNKTSTNLGNFIETQGGRCKHCVLSMERNATK